MTFIRNLNRQRHAATVGGAGAVENGDKAKVDQGQPAGAKEPELRGGQGKPVAKKATGLGGAALRTTVGDLFSVAERLGMPGPMVAKYAGGMDQQVAPMRAAAEQLEAALARYQGPARDQAAALPAQLVLNLAKGLGALDQTSAGQQIRVLAEAAAELVAGPKALTGAQIRAVETLAHAIGQMPTGEPAAELRRAAKLLTGKNDEVVLQAALKTLDEAMPRIAESGGRGALLRATLEALFAGTLDAVRPAEQVAEGAVAQAAAGEVTDAQKGLLAELVGQVRQTVGQLREEHNARAGEVNGLRQQYEARGEFPPLADVKARVDAELSPAAQAAWYGQLNAWAGQPETTVVGIGRVLAEVLGHALPPADQLNQLSQSIAQLAQQPGVTAEALKNLAAQHVRSTAAERVPGTIAILTNVLAQARGQNVDLARPGDLATLANALIGRTDAFAAANGPVNQLVQALAAADDEATRAQVLKHGARFAHAISTAEPGPARDHLQAVFADDLKTVAKKGLDLGALAATYKGIPEDGVVHFAAIAIHRGLDVDQLLDKLQAFFKHARSNKEHIRGMRNFITLGDKNGANVAAFVDTVAAAKLKSPVVTRTVAALLQENNLDVTAEQLERASAMIGRGENVASAIEAKLNQEMVKKLNLDQLLQDAQVKVTDSGYAEATGPLAQFFSLGANANTVNKDLLKGMLIAVLEDKFPSFRFTTPPAARQLEVLDGDQKAAWLKPEVMTHVRFEANGKAEFDKRVASGANIAKAIFEKMTATWGDLGALRQKQADLANQLRQIDKNDLAARRPLVREIGELPAKIEAMSWAKELSEMTPETTTPLRFAGMADQIPSLGRMLGPSMEAALNELTWTVRIDDLAYKQVVTNDGPNLATMYRLAVMQCLRGWPQDTALMPYLVDANKRMIVTKNQAGEERRAVMRVVTRTDEGHVGEPMLVLERSYPDNQAEEEKQRLVEHMLRRAVEMGISAAYPTEYYWDASKTGRHLMDMNAVLEDLNRRYNTTSEIKVTKVTNRGGNNNPEYIDSAPLRGAADAGNVQIRRYDGTQDQTYENKFLILTPKL